MLVINRRGIIIIIIIIIGAIISSSLFSYFVSFSLMIICVIYVMRCISRFAKFSGVGQIAKGQ